jgi:DNA-binding MarR family transcriptional regulator
MSPLHSDDYDALANFRHLLRRFLRFSKDFLRTTGHLNPEQYEALLAIRAFRPPGGLTISGLSERLQVKHHSAVHLVDRLVERKLVTRETDTRDRRQKHLKLTSKGAALLEKLAAVHRRELRERSGEMITALKRLSR